MFLEMNTPRSAMYMFTLCSVITSKDSDILIKHYNELLAKEDFKSGSVKEEHARLRCLSGALKICLEDDKWKERVIDQDELKKIMDSIDNDIYKNKMDLIMATVNAISKIPSMDHS